jgi:hypothetical protein
MRLTQLAQIARYGVLLGIAGGIAEVIWITFYGSLAGGEIADVARGISATVGAILPGNPIIGAPALNGIVIHMVLAVAIGVALIFAWRGLAAHRPAWINEFVFMLGALAVVWAFNFFVVLPLISPSFVDLVPYPVSLISKLLFGLAGAFVLRGAAYNRFAPIPARARAR